MPYLGILGQYLTIVVFEINTLEYAKNESLTRTVNFGMGPLFHKVWSLLFLKARVLVRVRFIKYPDSVSLFYTNM